MHLTGWFQTTDQYGEPLSTEEPLFSTGRHHQLMLPSRLIEALLIEAGAMSEIF